MAHALDRCTPRRAHAHTTTAPTICIHLLRWCSRPMHYMRARRPTQRDAGRWSCPAACGCGQACAAAVARSLSRRLTRRGSARSPGPPAPCGRAWRAWCCPCSASGAPHVAGAGWWPTTWPRSPPAFAVAPTLKTRIAQTSASRLSGGFLQREIMPQTVSRLSQPSHLGDSGLATLALVSTPAAPARPPSAASPRSAG